MKKFTGIKNDNKGVGVIEVILILVVLIALALIFQEQITGLAENIWNSISRDARKIY